MSENPARIMKAALYSPHQSSYRSEHAPKDCEMNAQEAAEEILRIYAKLDARAALSEGNFFKNWPPDEIYRVEQIRQGVEYALRTGLIEPRGEDYVLTFAGKIALQRIRP
jgi:hypothetical protein